VGFFGPLILAGLLGKGRTGADAAGARIAFENFRAGIAPDREHDVRMARTRWLERNGAIASFTCGLGALPPSPATEPDPWGERTVEPVPATVAVTPTEFAFLREGIEEIENEPIVEMGRFPREALLEVVVVDTEGRPVAGLAGDVFEPSAMCEIVVRWRTSDGGADEDAFVFRSISVAEETAGRFRRFAMDAPGSGSSGSAGSASLPLPPPPGEPSH
jgi:hypothetical protein